MILIQYWRQMAVAAVILLSLWKVYDYGYDSADLKWQLKWRAEQDKIVAANIAHEKQVRELQSTMQSKADEVNKDAKIKIDSLSNDVANARATADSLRKSAAQYAARANKCSTAAGIADTGSTTGSADNLLAELLARATERAGEMAEEADRRRIAGLACEQAYDALKQTRN